MQAIAGTKKRLDLVLRQHGLFCNFRPEGVGYYLNSYTPLEIQMPQNTKDSSGGKNHPARETGADGGKNSDKESANKKSDSPTGSHNKGEKKSTP